MPLRIIQTNFETTQVKSFMRKVRLDTVGSARYRQLGWALALFATFAFSFAPPLARFTILGGLDSTTVLMLRVVIASALFGVTLASTDRANLRISRRGLGSALFIGALNAVGMILFFLSLSYLEASLGAMILALSPPMVLSLLALRGERLTRRHLVRLGLALAGVYLLVGPSGDVNWTGVALALVATIIFSVQLAATQWLLVGYPIRSIVFYVTITMTLFVVGWWVFQGAALDAVDAYCLGCGAGAGCPEHLWRAPGLLRCRRADRQRATGAAQPAGNDAERDLVHPVSRRATDADPVCGRRADPDQRLVGGGAVGAGQSAVAAAIGTLPICFRDGLCGLCYNEGLCFGEEHCWLAPASCWWGWPSCPAMRPIHCSTASRVVERLRRRRPI